MAVSKTGPFIKKGRLVFLYLKDLLQMAIFSAMSNRRVLIAFNASPVSMFFRGILGAVLLGLAIFNLIEFIGATNKTLDGLLTSVSSLASSLLSDVALYGGIIARLCHLTFAAGPWLLFTAFTIGALHQAFMCGRNLYRASQQTTDSDQRKHFLQAAFSNGVASVQLALCAGSILFAVIIPGVPLLAMIIGVSAVSFIAAQMLWRMTPQPSKQAIKKMVDLDKPEEVTAPKRSVWTPTSPRPGSRRGLAFFENQNGSKHRVGADLAADKQRTP